MNLESRLEPNGEDVAAKVIEGEAIIINLTTGMYYSLAGVGAVVWEYLAEGHSVGEVAATIAARYEVPLERVRDDAARLAAEFMSEGLMRVPVGSRPLPSGLQPAGMPVAGYAAPELQKYADMADLLALDPPLPGLANNPWTEA